MKLNSIKDLRTIVKAKFSDKSGLGSWYTDRLEICNLCPLNHKNKVEAGEELTAREKIFVTANLGKPTCTACGCEIAAKASVKEAECGLAERGEEPLWTAIVDPEVDAVQAKIFNKNPDKAVVSVQGGKIDVNYGVVPHGFDSKIELIVVPKEGPATEVKTSAGCGCTDVRGSIRNGEIYFTLGYDTVGRKGGATKTFNIHYKTNGKMRLLVGTLRINVQEPISRNK
jgi:hypothetical protein